MGFAMPYEWHLVGWDAIRGPLILARLTVKHDFNGPWLKRRVIRENVEAVVEEQRLWMLFHDEELASHRWQAIEFGNLIEVYVNRRCDHTRFWIGSGVSTRYQKISCCFGDCPGQICPCFPGWWGGALVVTTVVSLNCQCLCLIASMKVWMNIWALAWPIFKFWESIHIALQDWWKK